MKALPTQFDRSRRPTAVATPTCSSCCCCCCCAATIVTSSAIIAQKVQHEGKLRAVPHRGIYTLIAALYLPLGLAMGLLVYWAVDKVFAKCRTVSQNSNITSEVCTQPGSGAAVVLGIATSIFLLWLVYSKVGIARPVLRTTATLAILAGALWVEFLAAAVIILGLEDAGGGIVYLGVALIVTLVVSINSGVRLRDQQETTADTDAPPPTRFLPAGSGAPNTPPPSRGEAFLPDTSFPEKHDDSGT